MNRADAERGCLPSALAMRQTDSVSGLGDPLILDGPLFVYGLLQPSELAYSRIAGYVNEANIATTPGSLRLRDGLPLLDPDGAGAVHGHLLRFDQTRLSDMWEAVADFEPSAQYKFSTIHVEVGGSFTRANVLLGRKLSRGTAPDPVDRWSAASDQVFVEGLAEVFAMTVETAPNGITAQPDRAEFWLWSIVERYTALRYGPDLAPGKRVTHLGDDPDFRLAVTKAGALSDSVYGSLDPDDKAELKPNGSGASKYYYLVRSNLSHRGKGAFRDGKLVLKALVELHDVMRLVLAKQVPSLALQWERNEPDGWLLRARLPADAISAARPPSAVKLEDIT